jgi:hypothetical protein
MTPKTRALFLNSQAITNSFNSIPASKFIFKHNHPITSSAAHITTMAAANSNHHQSITVASLCHSKPANTHQIPIQNHTTPPPSQSRAHSPHQ